MDTSRYDDRFSWIRIEFVLEVVFVEIASWRRHVITRMTARLITLSFLTATLPLTLHATAALAQPSPPPPERCEGNCPAEATAANDGEVIHIEERWPGTQLLDADDTTRAVSVRRAEPGATTAVAADLLEDLP